MPRQLLLLQLLLPHGYAAATGGRQRRGRRGRVAGIGCHAPWNGSIHRAEELLALPRAETPVSVWLALHMQDELLDECEQPLNAATC